MRQVPFSVSLNYFLAWHVIFTSIRGQLDKYANASSPLHNQLICLLFLMIYNYFHKASVEKSSVQWVIYFIRGTLFSGYMHSQLFTPLPPKKQILHDCKARGLLFLYPSIFIEWSIKYLIHVILLWSLIKLTPLENTYSV